VSSAVHPFPERDVLCAVEGAVATVTLNRPERRNAMTPDMRARLWEVLRDLDEDPAVKAIVLTGAGEGFCAGSDRAKLQGYTAEDVERRLVTQALGSDTPLRLTTPLVAAVNGATAGLGFAVAVMADVRFTSPEAKWTTAFARLGLIAEAGLSWLLPRIVGLGRATDLLVSARVFSGQEAYEMGLAQFVLPPDELLAGAQAYAAEIAGNSRHSVQVIREQLRRDLAAELDTALLRARELVVEAIAGPDFAEAQKAMAEKRDPRFD
jgi:enoyl-CoA hydratase/carnithine racemase